MENWIWAIFLKPFMIFAFLLFVWFCHWAVSKLPEGKLRRALLYKFTSEK